MIKFYHKYNIISNINMEEIIGKIYELAKKKMIEQGGYDREAFRGYINENINYYRSKGKLTDEDSDEYIVSQAMKRWDEFINEIARKKS